MKKILIMLLISAAYTNISAMETLPSLAARVGITELLPAKIKALTAAYIKIENLRYEALTGSKAQSSADRQQTLTDNSSSEGQKSYARAQEEFENELAPFLEEEHKNILSRCEKLAAMHIQRFHYTLASLLSQQEQLTSDAWYPKDLSTDLNSYALIKALLLLELENTTVALDQKEAIAFWLYKLVDGIVMPSICSFDGFTDADRKLFALKLRIDSTLMPKAIRFKAAYDHYLLKKNNNLL